jgi:hypothetical protein
MMVALACGFWVGPAHAQQIKNLAEVMPARCMAYVELQQPGTIMKEVAALLEGSALGNVPDSLSRFRGRPGQGDGGRGFEEVGVAGLIFAPEVVKELQRIQGGAFTLTGIDLQREEPEFIAVILPGDCNALRFAVRAFQTMGARQVGEVEGVGIYRHVQRSFAAPFAPGQPAPAPQIREIGPAIAMTADAIFIGTPDEVKDAIRRASGKLKDDTLAQSAAFQESYKQLGGKAGLFVYGDVPVIFQKISQAIPPRDRATFDAVMRVLNPKAIRTAAASLALENGTLRYHEMYKLDPNEKSPIVELLPAKGVDPSLLQFVPKDSIMAFALANDNGEKRWTQLLGLIDDISRAVGERRLPSEQLVEFEKSLGINLGKDVAGKITGAAFAVGDPSSLFALAGAGAKPPPVRVQPKPPAPPGVPGVPEEVKAQAQARPERPEPPIVLIIQVTDEETAKNFANTLIPKFMSFVLRQQELKPTTKMVDGQTIYTLEGADKEPFRYGRLGNTLVIGMNQQTIAQALNAGARSQGLLSDARVSAAVKEMDNPFVVVAVKPITTLAGMSMVVYMQGRAAVDRERIEVEKARNEIEKARPDQPKPAPRPEDPVQEQLDQVRRELDRARLEEERARRELERAREILQQRLRELERERNPLPPLPPDRVPPPAALAAPAEERVAQDRPPPVAQIDRPGPPREMQELMKLLQSEGYLFASAYRKGDAIHGEAHYTVNKALVAKLIDFGLEQVFRDRPAFSAPKPPPTFKDSAPARPDVKPNEPLRTPEAPGRVPAPAPRPPGLPAPAQPINR